MKINGNILTRIKSRTAEIEAEIAAHNKTLSDMRYYRNTLLTSVNTLAGELNRNWKAFLEHKQQSILSSREKAIRRFQESSPFYESNTFLLCCDFFLTLSISLMRFSQIKNGNDQYPYTAICCPCDKNNKLIQRWQFSSAIRDNFYGCNFIVFNNQDNEETYIVCTRGENLQAVNASKQTDYRWLEFNDVMEEFQESFKEHPDRKLSLLLRLENYLIEMNELQHKITALESESEELTARYDEIKSIAINENRLNEILNLIELFISPGKVTPKGMLLYGPPGTGKTLIARIIAKISGCHFEAVNIADLKGQNIGETGKQVKAIWDKCRKHMPAILFIDECEGVFPVRGSSDSDSFSNELVQTFLSEWDGFNDKDNQILVIGATNRNDILDTAVMSRFTTSIEIGLPDAEARKTIFRNEFRRAGIEFEPGDKMISESTGMSGRDIKTLTDNIAFSGSDEPLSEEYFISCIRKIRSGSSSDDKELTWDDIVLSDKVLADFRMLGHELRNSETLLAMDMPAPKSALLYGPPGTGKTQLARVLSWQSGLSFESATTSDLKGQYIGHSARKVKDIFSKARSKSPCILFLDEIDILTIGRGNADSFNAEVIGQLLQELDGITPNEGVFLLAASNHPEMIDSALMSRFERRIKVDLPDRPSREKILHNLIIKKPYQFDAEKVISNAAESTEGFSGRMLKNMINKAARLAMARCIQQNLSLNEIMMVEDDITQSIASEKQNH